MDIENIAKAWIKMWSFEIDDPKRDDFDWVDDMEYQFVYMEPENALDLVLTILKLKPNIETIEALAAGPLEEVLAQHGPSIIERVEEEVKSNQSFAKLLGGVWKNAMSPDVWARVQNVWDRSEWDGS